MKKSSGFLVAVLFLIAGFFAVSLSQEARAASGLPDSFADLVEKSERTVVNIYTKQVVKLKNSPNEFFFHGPNELSDLFKYFFEFPGFQGNAPSPEREIKKTSLGSGVIISSDGYIVTNNHVVQNAEEIHVRSSEHEEYLAKIIGRDPKTDVALIKIETDRPLPYAEFGDSDKLRVGDWVIAIGNPFGFEQTVTAGIVSGKGRSIGHGPYENFIQTDASINPGNSGGPLFNTAGKMVGINTAIFSRNGGNMGIGFAIPINMANNVVSQLKEHGKVIRGWLGVLIQNVTPDLAAQFGLDKPIGALVGKVTEDGPADKAGIKQGDIIIEYQGREVSRMSLLPSMVAQTVVGSDAELVVIRKGKKKKITVTIGKLKEDDVIAGSSESKVEQGLGLTVQELTPELAESMELDESTGLLVADIEPGTPAFEAGLRRGDVILEVDRTPVKDMKDFNKAMENLREKSSILFLLRRDVFTRFVVLKK